MLKVYTCNIKSVLEYAAQVWQDVPAYLSDAIESIQRRSLKISRLKLSTSPRSSKSDIVSKSQDIHIVNS